MKYSEKLNGMLNSIKKESLSLKFNKLTESLKESWNIQDIRNIVARHSAKKVNGALIDVQTANVMLTVFDALKPENQVKAQNIDIQTFAKFAWDKVDGAESIKRESADDKLDWGVYLDGELKGKYANENEAYMGLQKLQPFSADHAMKYEGWSIKRIKKESLHLKSESLHNWKKQTSELDDNLIIYLDNKVKPPRFAVRIQQYSENDPWHCIVETINPRAELYHEEFKTKAEALKYAMKYMETHLD